MMFAYPRTVAVRGWRVIRLDSSAFRELSTDGGATVQALLIVLLGAFATTLGTFGELGGGAWRELPRQMFLGYVGWVTGTFLVYLIGTKVLRAPDSKADWAAVSRVMGFAYAPVLLRVIGITPGIGVAVAVLTLVWQAIAMLSGMKEVLVSKSYWKPILILAMGAAPYVAVLAGFNLLLR